MDLEKNIHCGELAYCRWSTLDLRHISDDSPNAALIKSRSSAYVEYHTMFYVMPMSWGVIFEFHK